VTPGPHLRRAIPWSGPILLAGGLAFGLAIVLVAIQPIGVESVTPQVGALLLIASALFLLSLPAVYAVQAEAAGLVGLSGHALLMIGLLLLVLVSAVPILHPASDLPPGEDPILFLLALALMMGLLLTGTATWRAGVFPWGAGALLVAGTVGFFFVIFVAEFLPSIAGQAASVAFAILLLSGFAWIGATLWHEGRSAA
jgi:hypothetical protein